jgi:hypothetical protein
VIGPNTKVVHGWPGTQAGLTVWRVDCLNGQVAEHDWGFLITDDVPGSYGQRAIGWEPTHTGGAYGIEARFPSAADVDVFQIDAYAPGGQTSGYAQVNYYPRDGVAPDNVDWIGILEADFVDTQAGWHTIDASDWQYDWYRLVDDEFDGTVVQDQTIEQITDANGPGAAWFRLNLGCDGNPYYVDGFQLGSSETGWDVYDFEDFRNVNISLGVRGGRISTCHTSAGRFPNKVSFQGRISRAGPWQGWQFVGRRKGHWRMVAAGRSAGRFGFSMKVNENSYVDAVHPWEVHTRFVDSEPDNYVPAFPTIKLRASARQVRKGQPIVFTGRIKPSQKMSYTVLRAEARGRRWANFQSLGTHKTDRRGRFRFVVRTPQPGWARINIITKTEKDLTSAINPRAILYKVLKPKKKKKNEQVHNGPAPQPDVPYVPPVDPDPITPIPPGPQGRVRGYGNCGWLPAGRPPTNRPMNGPAGRVPGANGGADLSTSTRTPRLPVVPDTEVSLPPSVAPTRVGHRPGV